LTNTVDHASCKPAAQDRITKLWEWLIIEMAGVCFTDCQ
jgi:hypothetical protein